MKNDKYSQARGGWSRILDISCEYGHHVCYYQKDGPGPLKRMYIDRMINFDPSDNNILACPTCDHELGYKITYAKEKRPAFRLFQSSVKKKITKQILVK